MGSEEQVDSSTSVNFNDANLLDSIEKLLDRKLKPIEVRLALMEQKQDAVRLQHEKVLPVVQKIQRLVDDLNDQQETSARKIKDEIYNVQDTLDNVNEAVADIKSYNRDLLDNSDDTLDKVVKIHKHLKVQEVCKLTGNASSTTMKTTTSSQAPATAIDEDFSKLIGETVVPELQCIKQLLRQRSRSPSPIRPEDTKLKEIKDSLAEMKKKDLGLTETLANFDARVGQLIGKVEQQMLKFDNDKTRDNSNKMHLLQEQREQAKWTSKAELEEGLEAHRQKLEANMDKMEENVIDILQKKMLEIKKCVIEEANETQRSMGDFHQREKQCMDSHSEAIIKALVDVHGNHHAANQSALCTKIEMYHEGMRNIVAGNTKKTLDKLADLEATMKANINGHDLKADLEKTLTKMHLDSLKEMCKTVRALDNGIKKINEPKSFFSKMLKAEVVDALHHTMLQNHEAQMARLHETKEAVLHHANEKEVVHKNHLSSIVEEAIQQSKNLSKKMLSEEMDKVRKGFSSSLDKVLEQVEKGLRASSEILNSVEDLKQLTSSSIQSAADLVPKVEHIQETQDKNFVDVLGKLNPEAIAKECLGTFSSVHQESFNHIMSKFETVENRFAVIRKYVKHVPEVLQMKVSAAAASSEAAVTLSSPNVMAESGGGGQDLKLHVTDQCKILGDSIACALDKFLSHLDMAELTSRLKEVKELCSEQAKASVVEDQLQALATTILEPIEELKPIQEQLLATFEDEIRNLAKSQQPTMDSIETLNMNQSTILQELRKSQSLDSSSGWIANIVENLKKIQVAQSEVISKNNTFNDLLEVLKTMNSTMNNIPMSKHKSTLLPLLDDLRPQIEVFSELVTSLTESQLNKEDVKGLIKDVRAFVEHIVTKESQMISSPTPSDSTHLRRKSRAQKRPHGGCSSSDEAGPSSVLRRFRKKKTKLNYNEDEDQEESNN